MKTKEEAIQLANKLNTKHGTGTYCPVQCECGSFDIMKCNDIKKGYKLII